MLHQRTTLEAFPIQGLGLVEAEDDLAQLIWEGLQSNQLSLVDGDILVVASKIVSKAEGCFVPLDQVVPSPEAQHYAQQTGKDSHIVELVLRESVGVSRVSKGVLVVIHRLGFVCANAGIDQSNIADSDSRVLLLPKDPDASASRLLTNLRERTHLHQLGVIITDSQGRPFRYGNVGVAIGSAGVPSLRDLRGETDIFGRVLQVSMQPFADLVASTAQLLMGEGHEAIPVVLVRGLSWQSSLDTAQKLVRSAEHDLYR
ncbi:MAG: coenzyme F420-0:L-glutamate ligase [Phototrophicaceae bacterium]